MPGVEQNHGQGRKLTRREQLRNLLVGLLGMVEALLLARLLARLLAARVENSTIGLLYQLSGPLVGPLALLDAGQPRFGSSLELATLSLALLLPLLAYGVWRGLRVTG